MSHLGTTACDDLCRRGALADRSLVRMRRPLLMIATVVALAQTAACTCAERTAEDPPPDPDLVAHRVAPCEGYCEVMFSECGPFPTEHIKSKDECIRECATLEGNLSAFWGYQYSTGQDACVNEWQAHVDCLAAMSCEEHKIHWSEPSAAPPKEERPCFAEWESVTQCVNTHPCCEETQ